MELRELPSELLVAWETDMRVPGKSRSFVSILFICCFVLAPGLGVAHSQSSDLTPLESEGCEAQHRAAGDPSIERSYSPGIVDVLPLTIAPASDDTISEIQSLVQSIYRCVFDRESANLDSYFSAQAVAALEQSASLIVVLDRLGPRSAVAVDSLNWSASDTLVAALRFESPVGIFEENWVLVRVFDYWVIDGINIPQQPESSPAASPST